MLDLAIIGSGPAALTAALYARRSGLSVEIFEATSFGGALQEISHLANFPGFDGTGKELSEKLIAQVKSAGAQFSYGTCTSVQPLVIDGEEKLARAVLIATGSIPKTLSLPTTKPVSYCVLCDGSLYAGKNVLVIGGGNSAIGEAASLAKIAASVTVVSHSPLKAEESLILELKSHKNVKILESTEPTTLPLDSFDGIFVLIGKAPASDFMPASALDESGYIITDSDFQTRVPGVFAAGDVRASSLKQAIIAAGEGAAASVSIENFLK